MAIRVRDSRELEALGCAGFLRVLRTEDRRRYRAALFLVGPRGEPVEFTYSELEARPFLWRREILDREAARRLAMALFDACPRVPQVLHCLAEEVPPELFEEDLEVELPVARIAREEAVVGQAAREGRDLLGPEGQVVQIFWRGGVPAEDSPERSLVTRLAERGLLLEPFERAEEGLREVYGPAEGEGDGNVVEGPQRP
jgi:hypothetical protein